MYREYKKILKYLSHNINIISMIINIILTILLVCSNIQLTQITNLKFKQENRPYISIESLKLLDNPIDIFDIEIRGYGDFPANAELSIIAKKNTNDEVIMEKNIKELKIFPFKNTMSLSVKDSFRFKSKSNGKELLVIEKKSRSLREVVDSGEIVNIELTLNYTPLISGNNMSHDFYYKQDYLIKKDNGVINIKSIKFDAN